MRQLALIRDYNALHQALRNRVAELNITAETLDEVAGMTARYSSKILAPSKMKILGRISLGPILGAVGCCLILAEDPKQLARIRHRLTPRKSSRFKKHPPTEPRGGRQRFRGARGRPRLNRIAGSPAARTIHSRLEPLVECKEMEQN
jgi:hypothetical protein